MVTWAAQEPARVRAPRRLTLTAILEGMGGEARVMILSASVGAGHVRAAEAIEAALRRTGAPITVGNRDVLALMPPGFRKVYSDGYFEMIARAPRLVGWLYEATDRPFHKDPLRQKIEQAGARRLLKEIREYDPDIAVCTHFLPATLLDRERRKGRCRARIVTVVTDFEVHGFWLAVKSDHYFVATGEARAHLEALGIAPPAITVSGIPTHPVFAEHKDRLAMRAKHGLRPDLPAVLISAGGFGVGNAKRIVESLLNSGIRAQIAAVCGKSAALRSSIEKLAEGRGQDALPAVKAVGFTTEMDELMTAADVMIGKPGGLTTAESLIKGLAWVVVNPIPGQEERNAIHLLEEGVGVWCDNLHTLTYKVRSLLEEPGRLEKMRGNALRLARPDAGDVIARFVTGR
jgi:processive 1,2-diacylglycerol beta-glucosyltransferase